MGKDCDVLKNALSATALKRNSVEIIKNYKKIISVVKNSEVMRQQWLNYQKDFDYASDIEFADACDAIVRIMNNMKI